MNRIRELRKERGMTQAELAKVLKVTARTVGFYETGERDPDTDALRMLADFFVISIDYLLGRSDAKAPEDKINYSPAEAASELVFDKGYPYDEDLPEEAKEEIERFAEYIRYKYGKKQNIEESQDDK